MKNTSKKNGLACIYILPLLLTFFLDMICPLFLVEVYAADILPPTTTVSPYMGVYKAPQNITLTCSDGTGTGCASTNYCLGDGCTPSTVYSGQIKIVSSTIIRFYSMDLAGNSEAVREFSYVIDTSLSYGFDRVMPQSQQPSFNYPSNVAVDKSGNIYVVDSKNNQIQKLDPNGATIKIWGAPGTAGGQLRDPYGIVIDSSGNIYIADTGNNRIQKFDSNGVYLTGWGSTGSGNGQFNNPYGIAVDSAGFIYVAEQGNNRVQKFDATGNFVTAWGSYGSGFGQFYWPEGITVDASNNVYVTETGNNRIQKFTADGTFITTWGGAGSGYGQFSVPYGITTDAAGYVYVADHYNSRVQKFTQDGAFVSAWGVRGRGDGQFEAPYGITVDPLGNILITDPDFHRVNKFNSLGVFATSWGIANTTLGYFNQPSGITSDSSGNVYVADTGNNRIQKFDSTGSFLTEWGMYGSGNGSFMWPEGIAVDATGNIYVADTSNDRVQKFTASGTFLTTWGSNGSGNGQFSGPSGIAVDSAGNVYVVDTFNHRVQKFTSTGGFLTAWGSQGSADGQFSYPKGITIDIDGNIYVVDINQGRIQKFNPSGVFLTAWNMASTGFDYLRSPYGVSSDLLGNVYIADTGNNRIAKFSSTGVFSTGWGMTGSGNGEFNGPSGLTVDSAGNVYVADTYNHRIQKFNPEQLLDLTPPVTSASPAAGIYSSAQNLTLSCIDNGGSGCASTYYCLGTGCTPTTRYSGGIAIGNPTDISFYSRDVAGNTEAIRTLTYTINLICTDGSCAETITQGQLNGASVNSLGEVVWSQYDPGTSNNQIYSSTRGQLTYDAVNHYSPAVNNLGDLAWAEQSCGYDMYSNWICSNTIKGIIGGAPVTIGSSQNWFGKIDLNDRGEVVWTQQEGTTSQVYSNVRGKLTSGNGNRYEPSINNQGDVVYLSSDPMMPGPWQVYRLSAGSTIPVAVTNDVSEHRSPAISDSGEVVWSERNPSSGIGASIVSSTRGVLVPAVTDIFGVDLNNCGDIIYITYENGPNKLYRLGSSAPCVSYPGANDTQTAATAITFGDIYTGLMDNTTNPVDWYRFDATAGDSIHITVNFDNRPTNGLNIGLYDGMGNLLRGPTSSPNPNPVGINTTATFSGTYYLKVEAPAGHFGYTVSLSKYTNNCGVGPCPEVLTQGQLNGASVNSLGEVVWSQYDPGTSNNQIYSSTRGQLTYDAVNHYSPAVNNLGDLAWAEQSCGYDMYSNWICSNTIKGTIGGAPVTIGSSQNWFGKIDLNDRGEVVWVQTDESNFGQIFSNIRGQLTSGSLTHTDPAINNNGDVVYAQADPALGPPLFQVYKLSELLGTVTVALTNDGLDHRSPVVSDSGEVVWIERDTMSYTPAYPVVSNVRGLLVPASGNVLSVDENNCGDLIYITYENGQNKLYRLGSNAPCVSYPGANDTQTAASPVKFGDIYTGLMDSTTNPVDWYQFQAAAGDSIHITVNFDNRPPNALNIGLYNAQGDLLSGPVSGGSSLGINTTASMSGTYYLKMEALGRFGYTVSLSKYTNNCGVGPCPEVLTQGQLNGASVNSLGEVVWSQYDPGTSNNQIYSSTRGQLTYDAVNHYSPAVNNLGDLAWAEQSCGYDMYSNWICSNTIKGTIGGAPVTIGSSQNWLGKIDLNDRGEVVWTQQEGTTSQVYSNVRGKLTSGDGNRYEPSINNQGDVVYLSSDSMMPGPWQVYRLSAGSTIPVAVTNDVSEHRSPAISDSGEVVWSERNPSSGIGASIVSSTRGVLVPAVTDIFGVDLNNCGDIIYITYENGPNKLYRLGSSVPCVSATERQFILAVNKDSAGSGNGQLSSMPAGIMLSIIETSSTTSFVAGTIVTLVAIPDQNSTFTSWSGACNGTGDCVVTMDMAKRVTAIFSLKPVDVTPPVTSVLPETGSYTSPQTVALACSDSGSGCATTWYCFGTGCTPTTVYSGTIPISSSTELRFTSVDAAGNSEVVRTASYTIAPLVKVDGLSTTYYNTVQSACNAAATGSIVKLMAATFVENLTWNNSGTVVLRGGYDDSYNIVGGTSFIKGTITITAGTMIMDGIVIV